MRVLKLRRFLKPFLAGLVLAVVLLFVQAVCELNLPNFMSRIVNVGIQQGGVEDATPRALTQGGYDFVTAFMDDGQRTLAEQSYRLVSGDEGDEGGRPYSETWPKAADEQIYVLDPDVADETLQGLDVAFGDATWTMVGILQRLQEAQEDGTLPQGALPAMEDADASSASDVGAADPAIAPDLQSLDLAQAYRLQPLLDLLPQSWYDEAREQALGTDQALREQSGTMLVAGLYRELGRDMASLELGYILRIGLVMLLITALSGVAAILVGYLSSRIGAGVARDLRTAVFEKVTGFSHTEFDRFSTASLITRSTNDITVIQTLLTMGIRMICYAPIMGIGGTAMALSKSVSMSWIIGVAVVVLVGIVLVLFAVVMPKFKVMQTLVDRLNLVARETLNGLEVIRAFSRSGFEQGRFEGANLDLTRINLFVNRAMTLLMPVMMLFMNALTILIIWVGSQQVAASQMQVGDMMAYMQYVMQIIMSFMFIAMLFVFIPRASVSANRLNEVLEASPSIVDPPRPRHIDPVQRGRIEFRSVDFCYEGAQHNALNDISFVAEPGQTTALIGPTGSGKSTVINLIERFYDVTAGAVLVGGTDVRELAQAELRASIGYVPQKSVLMAGTIASNMAYGTEGLSSEEQEKVAEVAQALEFVDETEGRFDAPVAQGGSNVSGGQRQRLAIARALAVRPDVYLFDDSFSALDFTTDKALRQALASSTSEATLVIVAQRVSTIMDADRIFVIDEGRIVGSGTHAELLASCDAYREIASSQLSEHELAGAEGGGPHE
ncbi:MAG: ABC transporter ATP-binding protein/permease [Coriobacteriales bacterium]|nr:ABC transporter ATP-binding protein/permease [Coriobacteriales bacterium]